MQEVIFLSSKGYADPERNYGDCVIINTGKEIIIYDCGSKEHAERVIKYMDDNNFEKAKFILSHNDSDHFDGLLFLLEQDRIESIRTTLLLKYVGTILDAIGDGRRENNPTKKAIMEKYDKIAQLTGQPIEDIYEHWDEQFAEGIEIIGPDFDYLINAVAKYIDSREGDSVDCETIVNAASILVSVDIGRNKLLLCGDCSFTSIEDILSDFRAIQLPHHGKQKQGEEIFEAKADDVEDIYIISDNTGNTNGGSDKLDVTGHRVFNTKEVGDVVINEATFDMRANRTMRRLGDAE